MLCPRRRGGLYQWEGGGGRGKGKYGAKICEHMYVNATMIPVETTPGIGGGGR
jgi:hypothetical protein